MAMRLDPAGGRIETGGTGPWLAVLGLLMAAGSGVLIWTLWGGGGGIEFGNRPARAGDAWLPALFGLAGLLLAGYRTRTEFDIGQRLRIQRSRWWWHHWERREPLGEPRRVTLDQERRGSGKNSRVVFPVRIETDLGAFELAAPGTELRARRDAEAVARAFTVPMADRRGGAELVRRPEELDRSVLETTRSEALPSEAPANCRVRAERHEGSTVFRVPAPLAWLLPLFALPCLIPAGLVLWIWLPRARAQGAVEASVLGWVIMLGVPLVMAVLPLAVLMSGLRSSGLLPCRIYAGSAGLRVGRRRFALHELEELHVTGGSSFARHLRIAGDHAACRIGRGLRLDELHWLRAALLSALKHGGG